MLASFDNHGVGLQVLFRGDSLFKTKFGGFVTLLVYILMVGYASQKIIKLYTHDDSLIVTIEKLRDKKTTPDNLNFTDHGFDLTVGVTKKHEKIGIEVPRDIGEVRLVTAIFQKGKGFRYDKIPQISCNLSAGSQFENLSCFDLRNTPILEHLTKNKPTALLLFLKCNEYKNVDKFVKTDKITCKSDLEIEKWLSDKRL